MSNCRILAFIVIVILLVVIRVPVAGSPFCQENKEIRHVGNIFDTGYIIQDRNKDEVSDFINVRIILPQNPSEAEIVSAANIGARLGYETSALDLDFTGYDSEERKYYDKPVILIGKGNKLLSFAGLKNQGTVGNLGPGQGDVSFFKKNAKFRRGGIVLTGYDASGLLAAANYFSGRYPNIWKPEGKTYADLVSRFFKFFKQKSVKIDELLPSRIVLDSRRAGPVSLRVDIRVPKKKIFAVALKTLESKKEKSDERKDEDKEENGKDKLKLKDLEFEGLHRLEVNLIGPDSNRCIDLLPQKPWIFKPASSRPSSEYPDFTLSELYTIKGIFTDTNKDYVPDNVVSYVSLKGTDFPAGIVNIAARTGLETAGMRLPFVRVGGEEFQPEKAGFPVIFGSGHLWIERLMRDKKLQGISGSSGSGYIQFVPEGINQKNALVISGKDAAGLEAVSDYVSKRLPYLWEYGKGNYRIFDIENDVRRFFQVKEASAQSVVALRKLKTWLRRIKDKDIEAVEVGLSLKDVPEGLEEFADEIILSEFPQAETAVKAYRTGFGANQMIFKEQLEIPWEVDEFWQLFQKEAIPKISAAAAGKIIVRVSESPEVRAKLKVQIKEALKEKGVKTGAVEVVVLCAYKQGFSWLNDEILPKIRNKKVGAVNIKYHSLKDSEEIRWQTVNANTRWLQEIFPIDTVFARELAIPASVVTFSGTRENDPIYSVKVTDKKGRLVLEESFDPKYVVRPFFDLFPEYESVRVTTGWVSVEIKGEKFLDKRIKTDPERFWDHLQTETFRKMIDYVMDIQDGKPLADNAPYFDKFLIDLTLSEPNYRLGIDEEVISSTEALHEDILFHTLAFFNRIGGRYDAGSLRYPGRILPFIQPPEDGKPGEVKIMLTGKEKGFPELIMTYKEKGQEPVKQRYPLLTLDVKPPKLRGVEVKSGEDRVSRLLFDLEATDKAARFEEFKLRGTEAAIDSSFISAEKLNDMINILGKLQNRGIFEETLSYDRVGEVFFHIIVEDDDEFSNIVSLKQSLKPLNTQNPVPVAEDFKYEGQRIIQWDTPMNPAEAAANLARLNTFAEVNSYYMATSFLGNDVFAADLYLPVKAKFISQAKHNALKPTLLLYGRVHGNEVSSTRHLLRLAELCATEPAYRDYLKNVNLVIYPVTNPDGAQLAYEMQKVNPDFMLHAGRYGALGTDVRSRGGNQDNHYPEAGQVFRLWEAWLPDIVIDMHGVPSHEWVQYFAGYSAWVNSRKGGARSYWLPRGWYIPGFSWIEDEKHSDLMKVQKAITDAVVNAVTSQPEVEAMNRRIYERYIKYGKQDKETYREYFYKGIQFEARMKGRKIKKSDTGITGPNVTYYSIVTEAADETARGDWLKMVCKAGLAHSTALIRYLNDGINKITHEYKDHDDYIIRRVFRKKPVLPKKSK